MDHTQACPYCPKWDKDFDRCSVFRQTDWVNVRGGCGLFPQRDMTGSRPVGKKRAGQQKQQHSDRSYNNAKSRRKYR